MTCAPTQAPAPSLIREGWAKGEAYWTVEMAPRHRQKVAVTWTGRATGKPAAIAQATSAAIVGLRATAWRKGAEGPPADLSLRIVSAEEDLDEYRETLTIEQPALDIPGVKRRDGRRQRIFKTKAFDALGFDLATCALGAHGIGALPDAMIKIETAEPPDRVEKRLSLIEDDGEDEAAVGHQDFAISTVEAGLVSGELCGRGLDGALQEAALALAVVAGHGINGEQSHTVRRTWDTWTSASATMRAAKAATLGRDARAASRRIAKFLLAMGLADQAAAIARAFDRAR